MNPPGKPLSTEEVARVIRASWVSTCEFLKTNGASHDGALLLEKEIAKALTAFAQQYAEDVTADRDRLRKALAIAVEALEIEASGSCNGVPNGISKAALRRIEDLGK